jgi:hypothetical protein
MNGDDQEFENFLRGFEPHRPRALPHVSGISHDKRRLAAAAVILVAVGGSLWMTARSSRTKSTNQSPVAMREHGNRPRIVPLSSTVALTRTALEDKGQFDAEMNDVAPRTMPRFDRADSSLRVLAKE